MKQWAARFCCGALGFAVLAPAAHSLTLTEVSASLELCHASYADLPAATKAMAAQGWLVTDGAATDAALDLLVWPLVAAISPAAPDLAKAALEQQSALAAFVTQPQTASILHRRIGADHEAALLVWGDVGDGQVSLTCQLALTSTSLIGHSATPVSEPTEFESAPGKAVKIHVLNAALIEEQSGFTVSISGTLQTTSSFAPSTE